MLERIYKQYVKNVNKGIEPMEFLKSLDSRIIIMALNERNITSKNAYEEILKILSTWHNQDKK